MSDDFLKLVPNYSEPPPIPETDERAARRRETLIKAGVSRRALAVEVQPTAALSILRSAIAAGPGIYALAGGTGTGKTVAAAQVLLEARGSVWWQTATEFAKTSRYKGAPWKGAKIGVLDDLGVEYMDPKGNALTNIDELVNHFYGEIRTLIITTNLNKSDFKDRYRERVASRIRESGLLGWMSVHGPDMRAENR